jgi:hypothetical protein
MLGCDGLQDNGFMLSSLRKRSVLPGDFLFSVIDFADK